MFHYRLAIPSRQLRIIIAACAAIVAHVGLISLNTDRKPTFAPHISIPRSVNVFLGQKSTLPSEKRVANEQQVKDVELKPLVPEEVEVIHSSIEESPAVKEPVKAVKAAMLSEVIERPVKELPVEKKQVIREESEFIVKQNPEALKLKNESSVNKQPVGSRAKQADIPAGEGVELPGAIQLAHPRYQLNSPPAYPGLARKRGQQGTVILQVLVNSEGRVEDLKIDVSSSFSLLDHAAMKAIKKWLFEPGRRDDEKIVMWVKVPVTFKLNNQ